MYLSNRDARGSKWCRHWSGKVKVLGGRGYRPPSSSSLIQVLFLEMYSNDEVLFLSFFYIFSSFHSGSRSSTLWHSRSSVLPSIHGFFSFTFFYLLPLHQVWLILSQHILSSFVHSLIHPFLCTSSKFSIILDVMVTTSPRIDSLSIVSSSSASWTPFSQHNIVTRVFSAAWHIIASPHITPQATITPQTPCISHHHSTSPHVIIPHNTSLNTTTNHHITVHHKTQQRNKQHYSYGSQ